MIFGFIIGTLVEIGILAGLTTRDYFPTIDAVDPIGRELEPSKLLFELDVPQLLLGIFPSKLLKLAAIHNPFFSTNPALHPHPSLFPLTAILYCSGHARHTFDPSLYVT